EGEGLTLDLTTRPTRGEAGLAAGSASRVWTNLQRRAFPVSVSLPDGSTFSSEAVLAVLLSPETNESPTRLTVKLPATDLPGVRRTLARLPQGWQLDEADVATWAARAAAVTTESHAYSTRVFAAAPAGFVRRELQV